MRRLLPLVLPAVLLLLLPGVALPAEAPEHVLPEARPIQLDGNPLPAEWSDALVLELTPGTVLRMQQFRGTVMLAFESDRVWTDRSVLSLFLCPEGPKAGGRGPGCVRIDFEPLRHDRPHVLAWLHDANGVARRIDGSVVARQTISLATTRIELAFASSLLGQGKEKRVPVRLCAQWARYGATPLHYPTNVTLRAAPGAPPPDFVSAGRWARLTGFGDPTGAGAFPTDEWKAWVKHDEELARHGMTAHRRVALLREEWQKEDKRDEEMLGEIVENLLWIRAHEPLTAGDLIAMATLWRYLGRHDQAIGALTTIVETSRDTSHGMRALHERALAHRAAERFEAEAADWRRLATMARKYGARYEQEAVIAETRHGAWLEEQTRRAAVEADAANPRVRLETARGPVVVVLHAKAAPAAVKHFLGLVDAGFYDGTLFHRVKGDFMAQGGDPKSRDLGCEFAGAGSSPVEIDMEINADHDFFRGALCFARPGHKEQNGSQFFLMTAPKPDLGRYTIFGHVVSGMDAVDRIEMCDELTRVVRGSK